MMQIQRDAILAVVVSTVREIMDTSLSESDDVLEILETLLKKRKNVPRVQNYVELIVPTFTDQQFKTHFRMCMETFNYILSVIELKLKRYTFGTPMVCPRKQFLLALWRLATPDSLS